MTNPLRVLYVGTYKASYPRNHIFLAGLRAQEGVQVVECNEPRKGLSTYARLAWRLWKLRGTYDMMLVGFPGQEVMFVARLCASAPIVFDVFTSHYMGYVIDRKYFSPHSFRAKIYRFLDRWSCRLADTIILDTNAHIDFFVKEFGIPRAKFSRVFLGANSELHQPRPRPQSPETFTVLFWGGFIPLQGTEHIVQAAARLKDAKVHFVLAGAGQNRERDMQESSRLGLTNIVFPGKISDQELVEQIRNADICLGAFDDGIKADSTIQNKIFEALASAKPLITARTTAIGELLTDGEHCLLCAKADPVDLAQKIIQLQAQSQLRDSIAQKGYTYFQEHLSEQHIGRDLAAVLVRVLNSSRHYDATA